MTARLKKTTDIDNEVFAMLHKAAKNGEPTPSNKTCAREIGVSEYTVSRSFSRMHASGRIVLAADPTGRRRVTVPGVGQTEWTVMGNRVSSVRSLSLVEELRAPSDTPWTGNCFAAHDIDPGDDIGTSRRPETIVPRCGVLA
jgi:hypothetical protein